MPSSSLRRGDVIRVRDERWTIDRHIAYADATVVEVSGCDRTNRGARTRFLLPCELIQPLPMIHAARVVSRRRWRHLARHALARAAPPYDALRTVAGAGIDLLPFQLEPALAVTRGVAARLLIADEVGLGKTVQAGLIVAETLERCADARVLVVVPAALREQWCSELRCRFHLRPAAFDSTTVSDAGALHRANPWTAQRLIVTSSDYVKRPEAIRSLETLIWDLLVVDEAHNVAGRSDRNAALSLLGERARTLVLLTATPHSGDEAAFARLCEIGALDRRFPLLVFRRTRSDTGLPSGRRTKWLKIRVTPAEAAMHRALRAYARRVWNQQHGTSSSARLAMIVLMRRAGSSACSLARSIERRLSLLVMDAHTDGQLPLPLPVSAPDDEEPLAELGAPGLLDSADERRRLEQILHLARIASRAESKFGAVSRLLRRARQPAVVFTEYRDTLVSLEHALAGRSMALLHGGLTASEREGVLNRFRSGAVDVLLATDTASEGLNLQQRCRLVVNLELPWTPTRLEQRVGRVDRIGQRQRVHAVHLMGAGTSEESTVATLLRRIDRVRNVTTAMQGHVASEGNIANSILGDAELASPDVTTDLALPRGVTTTNLRDVAHREVVRAAHARGLITGEAGTTYVQRPFVAVAHRRMRQTYWAYCLELTAADDELIWDALIGIAVDGDDCRRGTAADIRGYFDRTREGLSSLLWHEHERLRTSLAATLRAPVALATIREEAIIRAVRWRHGRMAVPLVQGGLFDRRAERTAAARKAEIAETLRRCESRLEQLARRHEPRTGRAEPVFALFGG